jgi:hypothetical protein
LWLTRLFRKFEKEQRVRFERPIPEEICRGMTLEEYIKYEKEEKGELASWAYKVIEEIGEENKTEQFEFRVMYYWDCIVNLREKQKEILELWDELYREFDKYETIISLQSILTVLAKITYESGIDWVKKGKLDDKLISLVESRVTKQLQVEQFSKVISDLVDWYYYKADYYYKYLNIPTTEVELEFLKRLYNWYEREFEALKTEHPSTFLMFTGAVYYFYKNLPDITDGNYDSFFKYVMLGRISVSRAIGDLDIMSKSIYLYNEQISKNYKGKKKLIAEFLRIFTGYGEKPFRLIWLYICLQLIFLMLLYPYSIHHIWLNGVDYSGKTGIIHNLVSILYFNNTTMLTIGYGDIFPVSSFARFVVSIEQVIGFIVTGSFVALNLRKIFRF